MYITPLNFNQVLDRFYRQDQYEFLLLFVSSFDGNDKDILREIVNNAQRIDRITGERICFLYFVKDTYDSMNEKLTRWIGNVSDYEPLYGKGVSLTMDTADDICKHFKLLRSTLPAFILVDKNRKKELPVFSIKDYNDFESILSPLLILHSYLEDERVIVSRYEYERKLGVITQDDVDRRTELRSSWSVALKQLERKKSKEISLGLIEQANKRDIKIQEFRHKLQDYPNLELKGVDETIIYPQKELDSIRNTAIEKLNLALNSHDGEYIMEKLQDSHDYCESVVKIWELVSAKRIRISRIIETIRHKIYERGFDVFISCKSQDYAVAHELYNFLLSEGFKPFIADTSIKEVGIDQYTVLIGEVINVCDKMIVFATDIDYIESPYVAAEWHTFVNDINTGNKPNAKIVNILSPDINIHKLPAWLRDKQCFTIESYKDSLVHFLRNRSNEDIKQLQNELEYYWTQIYHNLKFLSTRTYDCCCSKEVDRLVTKIRSDKYSLERKIEDVNRNHDSWEKQHAINHLRMEIKKNYEEWEHDYAVLEREIIECDIQAREKEQHLCLDKSEVGSPVSYIPNYDNNINRTDCSTVSIEPHRPHSSRKSCIRGMPIGSIFRWIISRRSDNVLIPNNVYSSIFAPAEVKPKFHMLVQVYLHLYEETEKVNALALESQKDAERRDYIPLQCKLKKGDKVDVQLNIYGETLLMTDKKSVVWQGSFTKCSFDYFVPKDIDVDELSCMAQLMVNGVPIGEMRFITKIVNEPRRLNPEIIAHKYNKVFISYAHKDEARVKSFHEGLKLAGIEHFFDRDYLKAGDIFPQVIQDYINTADLFVLFWSKNASMSEYVEKERAQALLRAFPHVKPQQAAKLSIYSLSIEPRTELPADMREYYHFGEI